MKTRFKQWFTLAVILVSIYQLRSQGYIVQNGVITNFSGAFLPGEISVLYNPYNLLYYTGFALEPIGKTQPTTTTNTFLFDKIVDVGVRVFLLSSNDSISLQPVLAGGFTELNAGSSYVFTNRVPVYLGLYTGNQSYSPPDGIYNDPLFGWAELENVNGTIQLLGSALEYQGGGIIAGTQTIITVPEPNPWGLSALGGLLLAWRRGKVRALLSPRSGGTYLSVRRI